MGPASLRYTESHEWVAMDADTATVGITQFAVDQLRDLVHLELPPLGRRVQAGEPFGEVESVKSVSDLYAPVSGEIIAVNDAVRDDAMKVAEDPYGAGWMIKLRVAPGTNLDQLLTLEQYQKQIGEQPD
jgi:glycine cleavage system H protein